MSESATAARIEIWDPPASTCASSAAGDGLPGQAGRMGRLIQGDNLAVLTALAADLRHQIDLIYLDPPFATGGRFHVSGSARDGGGRIVAGAGAGEATAAGRGSADDPAAYDDRWPDGIAGYLAMMRPRLLACRELLSNRGTLYLHCDHRAVAHLKLLLDEIFGARRLLNWIVWRRQVTRGMKSHARFFARSADHLLMVAGGSAPIFHPVSRERLVPIGASGCKYQQDERGFFRTSDPGSYSDASLLRLLAEGRLHVSRGGRIEVVDGRVRAVGGTLAVKYYRERRGDCVVEPAPPDNIWDDLPGLGVNSSEYCRYPTQKPLALLTRIVAASSDPGSIVLDPFCGSGTTLLAAAALGRRWIGCDLGAPAIHAARKRLAAMMPAWGADPGRADDLGRRPARGGGRVCAAGAGSDDRRESVAYGSGSGAPPSASPVTGGYTVEYADTERPETRADGLSPVGAGWSVGWRADADGAWTVTLSGPPDAPPPDAWSIDWTGVAGPFRVGWFGGLLATRTPRRARPGSAPRPGSATRSEDGWCGDRRLAAASAPVCCQVAPQSATRPPGALRAGRVRLYDRAGRFRDLPLPPPDGVV